MERKLIDIKNLPWEKLSVAAWKVRENAFIIGKTKVGAAILSDKGNIFSGCNCEHKYRSHDIHAEVNAVGNMIAGGDEKIVCILIAAERDFFTPCGSCMDWIMQFASEECFVGFENKDKKLVVFNVNELMPYYPR